MPEKNEQINNVEEGILKCLAYFGIFSYPLSSEEIFRYCQYECTQKDIDSSLKQLLNKGWIFNQDGLFSRNNHLDWITNRKAGNIRAMELLERSGNYVKIMSHFPFVEAIAISGSLSKYYASEKTDIDYFIITSSNRLWIARSLLHFFKKLTFITGHQHYFCMNYFVDTGALYIRHRNLYSAIELATLLPAYNEPLVKTLKDENNWVFDFLPNYSFKNDKRFLIPYRKGIIKKTLEFILNLLAPGLVNRFLMGITDKKWRRKWRHHGYSEESYTRAFYTSPDVSKNHPDDYEDKVLKALDK